MTFRDQVALVTGGASGIGRALATELAREGAIVVVLDRDAEGAARAARELGGRAEGLAVDVTDAAAFAAAAKDVRARHGRIDLLFNVAGVGLIGLAQDIELADWMKIIDVNLKGVVHGVAAVYPLMIEQRRGHIVNMASLSGLIPTPGLVPYSASKHAVVGLSLSLRAEARALGVRVTCACPGMVDTPMLANARFVKLDAGRVKKKLLFGAVASERCAKDVLRAVRRDRALAPIGGSARVALWLWRFVPWLVRWMAGRVGRRLQEERARSV
jgi:NAD(P)-dependent dehydrogenase (short-subunit alcohol dehydrogenase family)